MADFAACARNECDCFEIKMNRSVLSREAIETLINSDIWVLFYPLYVDGVPGHILSCLQALERIKDRLGEKLVYAVSNCGFYDGGQCGPSLDVIRNWAHRAELCWCGGIGVGGGGAVTALPRLKPGARPRSKLHKSLDYLMEMIVSGESFENRFVSIGIPRGLYKMAAEHGWRRALLDNGKRKKDISHIPE